MLNYDLTLNFYMHILDVITVSLTKLKPNVIQLKFNTFLGRVIKSKQNSEHIFLCKNITISAFSGSERANMLIFLHKNC